MTTVWFVQAAVMPTKKDPAAPAAIATVAAEALSEAEKQKLIGAKKQTPAVVPSKESKAVHRVELNSAEEVVSAVEDEESEVSNEVADNEAKKKG